MDLAGLIRTAKGDRSYTDLERHSGGVLGAKRWQQLATRSMLSFPDPKSINGIAKALNVSARQVVLACAESLGIDVSDRSSTLVALMPPGVERLSEREVSAILSLINSLTSHPEPIRFSTDDSPEEVERKFERARALLPSMFVPVEDGEELTREELMERAFGGDPEWQAYKARRRRERLAYLAEHPDERLPDDPVANDKPTDLSSRRQAPGLGPAPEGLAAREVTHPSQLAEPEEES